MSNPFITIIMPVYNATASLEKSVGSIINQTFQNFELLIVDDCSKDDSFNLCRKFAVNDSRIKILQTEKNSGAAAARNLALNQFNGQYINFVDADDWIESDVLERIAEILSNDNKIDCLKYGCSEDYFNGETLTYNKICNPGSAILIDELAIKQKIVELETMPLFGYIWNGFYRAQLINQFQIKFDENRRVNEDFDFNIAFFEHVKKFQTVDVIGYHYEKRNLSSLSSQANNYSYEINRQKITSLVKLFEEIPRETREQIFWLYVRFCYLSLTNGGGIDAIYKDRLFEELKRTKFNNVNFKQRLMIELLRNKVFSPLLSSAVYFIGFIKRNYPSLFAKLKR